MLLLYEATCCQDDPPLFLPVYAFLGTAKSVGFSVAYFYENHGWTFLHDQVYLSKPRMVVAVYKLQPCLLKKTECVILGQTTLLGP